ncbi:MAG: lipopolysaccharide biosynthesis protein [Sulfobacillus benefaciens]|uniref:Lipopolysaccharide biosynthesis protein n=1 Tax=Sulfobacillus benefaciens TaxID=453960 RepID=A0A2T2XJE7_9FIRM|nr:MAG: lipopolysaccharide biosynthesis protein [Sulfobacillus benefaciens]
MELQELWRVIRKRLGIIILIAVVATATSGILSKFVLPKEYAGTATLIVIPRNSAQDLLTSMVTGQQLVDTYAQLATSRAVIGNVAGSPKFGLSLTQLSQIVTATAVANTDLLTITVKTTSPTLAAGIANAVAHATVNEVTAVQGQKNLEIVNPAVANDLPVAPKTKTNVAIALVLGLVVGGGLAFLLEYLDDTIHSEDDVKRVLDLPLLTVIPSIQSASNIGNGRDRPATPKKGKTRKHRTVRTTSTGRIEGRL